MPNPLESIVAIMYIIHAGGIVAPSSAIGYFDITMPASAGGEHYPDATEAELIELAKPLIRRLGGIA